MKLYATVTSERATKGQGGNKYLDLNINVGSADNSVPFIEGRIERIEDGYMVYITTKTGVDDQCIDYTVSDEELKGKRQKDECAYNSIDGAYCTTHRTTH